MNNSIFSKKKVFWTSIILFAFMILFILPLMVDVDGGSRDSKISGFSQLNMKNVGTAILVYANKTGNEKMFPQNLETLVEQNYLTQEQIYSPVDKNKYLYLPGLNLGLPHSIPVLMEKSASHVASRGIKYGLILYGDFYLGSYREENADYYLILMEKLQEIVQEQEPSLLLNMLNKELEYSKNNMIVNVLLWRLGQAKYEPAYKTIEKCLRYYNSQEQDLTFLARSIAIEASYTLQLLNKPYDKNILKKLLRSENYLHRKKVWSILTNNESMLTPMSPSHIDLWLQKNK